MYVVLILMAFLALYPIWFAVLASGRAGDRLYTVNLAGMFVPTEWTWENSQTMLFDTSFLTWMKNSLIVAVTPSPRSALAHRRPLPFPASASEAARQA